MTLWERLMRHLNSSPVKQCSRQMAQAETELHEAHESLTKSIGRLEHKARNAAMLSAAIVGKLGGGAAAAEDAIRRMQQGVSEPRNPG